MEGRNKTHLRIGHNLAIKLFINLARTFKEYYEKQEARIGWGGGWREDDKVNLGKIICSCILFSRIVL